MDRLPFLIPNPSARLQTIPDGGPDVGGSGLGFAEVFEACGMSFKKHSVKVANPFG